MKGTLFSDGVEVQLLVNGESWRQGDGLSGSIQITNHNGEDLNGEGFGVTLAYARFKDLKKKADSFAILDEFKMDTKKSESLNWSFQLEENCPITDKVGSFYLLFGKKTDYLKGGQLQLNILPHLLVQDFCNIFQTFFRFKLKETKSKKNSIEMKFIAPKTKEYGMIDSLSLFFSTTGENLALKYIYNVQKLDYGVNGVKATKAKVECSQELSPKEYSSFGDSLDQDKVIAVIKDSLKSVKDKRFT